MPVATAVMLERRYRPASEDVLLRAFKVLDTEGKGFLTTDELTKCMTEEGTTDLCFSKIKKLF